MSTKYQYNWPKIEADYLASKESMKAFCEARGLNYPIVWHHGNQNGWREKRRATTGVWVSSGPRQQHIAPTESPPDVQGARVGGGDSAHESPGILTEALEPQVPGSEDQAPSPESPVDPSRYSGGATKEPAAPPEHTAEFLAACEQERARRRPQYFVPWASPGSFLPDHLPAISDTFRDGLTIPQRVCGSAPPQFGKTLLVEHCLIWHAWRRPGDVSAYVTYGTEPARARATETRQILQRLSFMGATWNTERIRFENGSQIIFTSVDGPLESHAITGWLVVDDPCKNPAEAASAVDRKRVEEWFFGTAIGRLHERSNVMVMNHRWSEHDLIEKLKRHPTHAWKHFNYPALNDKDESLWPLLKSTEFLKNVRNTTLRSVWEAYYQGNPQPEGGRLFHGVHKYTKAELPPDNYQVSIGIDCAYGDKKGGDANAIVVMMRHRRGSDLPKYYVLEVVRVHEPSPAFAERLKRVQARYPGSTTRWYPGPSEIGLAQRLQREAGVQWQTATRDKRQRAERCAAAWNDEIYDPGNPDSDPRANKPPQVFIPQEDRLWKDEFIEEVLDFSGVDGKDVHDDMVDAMSAAFDALSGAMDTKVRGLPNARGIGRWGGLVTNLH